MYTCQTCKFKRSTFRSAPQFAYKYVCAGCLWGVSEDDACAIKASSYKQKIQRWIDHGGIKNALLWLDRSLDGNYGKIRRSINKFIKDSK